MDESLIQLTAVELPLEIDIEQLDVLQAICEANPAPNDAPDGRTVICEPVASNNDDEGVEILLYQLLAWGENPVQEILNTLHEAGIQAKENDLETILKTDIPDGKVKKNGIYLIIYRTTND